MSVSLAPSRIPYIAAGQTGTTTGIPIDPQGRDTVVFYFVSTGTTSGGTLLIEEADYDPTGPVYAGTWSTIATVLASSFTGGAQIAYHVSPNSYSFIRVRISGAITGGGSVAVTLKMQ